MLRGLLAVAVAVTALVGVSDARAAGPKTEVIVALEGPPLARAHATSRALSTTVRRSQLNVTTPFALSYRRELDAAQDAFAESVAREIPGATVRRRYAIVANAVSVVVPERAAARLSTLPGVARVYPTVRYRARLDRTPQVIGALALWGPSLSTAGQGLKIGIIDDGIDHTHPFFSPQGYAPPAGYPRGQAAYTTAKVIVARAFPPRTPSWRHASKPFDPDHSGHATHVAGIAAGNHNTAVAGSTERFSGVAPRAYLGNYKVLTIPTAADVGLDGNSPEIVAGIEAAVADGMNVINLSIGEPEIEPARDIVTKAIDAAVDAGVVAVVAAGNDFTEFGRGSIGSPGSAAKAITVGATTSGRTGAAGTMAGFSSSGPTPLSLRLKPEVSAPGVEVASSIPGGDWASWSGTSMAAPHVAGGAALLLQRHAWTPAQVKSALVQTARAVAGSGGEAAVARQGAGLVDLAGANAPLVLASPAAVSFGVVKSGATVRRQIALSDAGGGGGTWTVSIDSQVRAGGVRVTAAAPTVAVPGELVVEAAVESGAAQEQMGFVVLRRGQDVRRVPYWLGVATAARLRPHATLRRPGVYRGTTRGKPSRAATYLYPELVNGRRPALSGPEHVFRFRLGRPAANFGVVVLGRARGVTVEPRIVEGGDPARLVGYTSLPLNLNPYLRDFLSPRAVSGAVLPAAGTYDIVFDSPNAARSGSFRFRFWVNDTTPPRLRVDRNTVRRSRLSFAATDAGSGIDPASIVAVVDGSARPGRLVGGRIVVDVSELGRGRHTIVLQVSDYQETRNMENVPRILPNTSRLRLAFTLR